MGLLLMIRNSSSTWLGLPSHTYIGDYNSDQEKASLSCICCYFFPGSSGSHAKHARKMGLKGKNRLFSEPRKKSPETIQVISRSQVYFLLLLPVNREMI